MFFLVLLLEMFLAHQRRESSLLGHNGNLVAMLVVVDPVLIFGVLDVEELSVMLDFLSLRLILNFFDFQLGLGDDGLLVGFLYLLHLDV